MGGEISAFFATLAKILPGIAQHPAYRQDLADFRRLLGDVAVESLTADHVRKYLVRLPNRLLFLSKRSEVRPFSAPLADEFLGEDSYGGIGIGWLFLIDRAKASREARIAAWHCADYLGCLTGRL